MGRKHSRHVEFLFIITIFMCVLAMGTYAQDNKVDMKDVRQIVSLPVDEMLDGTPVSMVPEGSYWKVVNEKRKTDMPLVAFFYSNVDPESQRVASLLKYVAPEYADELIFIRVQTTNEGKPDKDTSKRLSREFSLDKTPGILFYENVNGKMVLEDEEYVDADYKEFRTPSLMLWKTYYNAVRKELKKLLHARKYLKGTIFP
ncbi:MAG: hypothetical protein PHH49_02755 [Candidatus Omnitrophica bacterium]|nr:hypothetical protein [Candidatus Omnitrophota bacterium]MDD5487869.1 hypothetical protein [Candidatus Omnitrophota bacterium]